MLFQIDTVDLHTHPPSEGSPYYQIILLSSPAEFVVDFTVYENTSTSLLFLSPYQHLSWKSASSTSATRVLFHGDFYCIEFHKEEVACNGLLFNNIYLQPVVPVDESVYQEVELIVQKMQVEGTANSTFSESVIKAYLQLILALASKAKKQLIDSVSLSDSAQGAAGKLFQQLLEDHFTVEHAIHFYAEKLNLSPSAFSKRVKQQLGKAPSSLIQERVILESKKQLHLTYLSVKEIATQLGFGDEHYFSRYFKKHVGISPSKFREGVGISVVAQKSP
ncbi:helix-turn-helix domain-containing protein [Parapedobacter sp. 10938]|uniref:helix-turn-helix domain-containing protein n=1 Tax=Parapedobacter flavus TaxID=3110225 RepID=UPI002DBA168D|nr:helix-turn-helix domain-containing protein [Parapedobacter sp. 10938]MEC3879450.1 helix-turn-helix domain-containing protein [Parapedobacter sp. 10938]